MRVRPVVSFHIRNGGGGGVVVVGEQMHPLREGLRDGCADRQATHWGSPNLGASGAC